MLTFKRLGVLAALVVSFAAPATAAQGQDLRNPDQQFPAAPELTQDLRNADRRAPATVEPVGAPAVTTIAVSSDGFDWGDAGIGAAGGIAVLAMLAGLTMAGMQHRRGPRVTA